MYTEEVNKIGLSSNNDKRLPTFDRVTTYPYGVNAFRVCESEMLKVFKATEKLVMLNEKITICQAKMKLEMLSKECESEMHMKEKEKYQKFWKHVKTKCKSKMRKSVKVKNAK